MARQDYDSAWKDVLDRFFRQFLAFFLPEAHDGIDWSVPPEFLSSELKRLTRGVAGGSKAVDRLVKVRRIGGADTHVFVHVEIQNQHDASFARRMYRYNLRIYERYEEDVCSIAVLADETPGWRPNRFEQGAWGSRGILEYPMRKLVDYRDRIADLETAQSPFALVVLAALAATETARSPANRLAWKIRLVRLLYARGWSEGDVRALVTFIDWVLALPDAEDEQFWGVLEGIEEATDMPYMTGLERRAIARGERIGEQRGEQRGEQKGRQEALLHTITLGLERRFGADGLSRVDEISSIADGDLLERVFEAVWTAASLDEVRRVYAQ